MLEQFKEYYRKAKMNQERLYENGKWTKEDIDDDLIWYVPIYDVVNRKYAAFSSLLEAIHKQEKDPKCNGNFFLKSKNITDIDFIVLSYLFRLCGSGINYNPKTHDGIPFNTHGFGNFWIVNLLANGITDYNEWLKYLPEKKFCDNKGYMLPLIKGGLYNYIKKESTILVFNIIDFINSSNRKIGITEIVDFGNKYLVDNGYTRQNFVLTAFAMDMAEYYPDKVDRNSDVYVGSNAKKCLNLIMPNVKFNKSLRYLCEITGGHSKPYDMEDVACDFIRYIENFQSPGHIKKNNGKIYRNNINWDKSPN